MDDIPKDFKIEHDRLVYKLEPVAMRLFEIAQELPRPAESETIEFNGFEVEIRKI